MFLPTALLILFYFPGFTLAPNCLFHPSDQKKTCLASYPPCTPSCEWCFDKICMECKQGHFLNFNSQKCEPCYKNCKKCTGANKEQCSKLSGGFYMNPVTKEIKSCILNGCNDCDNPKQLCISCYPGFNPINEDDHIKECQKCEVEGCNVCRSSPKICDRCMPGWELQKDKTCKNLKKDCKNWAFDGITCLDCPIGYSYSRTQQKCVECPENCSDCRDRNICRSCNPGYFFNSETTECKLCEVTGCKNCYEDRSLCLECSYGAYFDFALNKCLPCPNGCAMCTGPKISDCLICYKDKRLLTRRYEDLPQIVEHKIRQRLISKYPKLEQKHMLLSRVLHSEFDRQCVEECPSDQNFRDDQYYSEEDDTDSTTCLVLVEPHPLYDHEVVNRLRFEFGKKYSKNDDESLKEIKTKMRKNDRRRLKRKKKVIENFKNGDL